MRPDDGVHTQNHINWEPNESLQASLSDLGSLATGQAKLSLPGRRLRRLRSRRKLPEATERRAAAGLRAATQGLLWLRRCQAPLQQTAGKHCEPAA